MTAVRAAPWAARQEARKLALAVALDEAHIAQRIARTIADTAADTAPAPAPGGGGTPDGAAVLRLFVATSVDGRHITDDEADYLRCIGRAGADSGVPLADVLATVSVATHEAYAAVADHVRPTSSSALHAYGHELVRFGTVVTSLLVDGYTGREAHLDSTGQARLRWAESMLDPAIPPRVVARHGAALGIDLARAVGLLFVRRSERHVVVAAARTAGGDLLDAPGSAPDDGSTVLVVVGDEPIWRRLLRDVGAALSRPGAAVAVGPVRSLDDLRARYVEALDMLPYATMLADGRPLVRHDDLRVGHLVATAGEVARRSVTRVVGDALRRLPSRTGPLVDTLVALVEHDFGVKETAAAVQRAPRTIRRRMVTIEQATGLSFSGALGPTLFTLFVWEHKMAAAGHPVGEGVRRAT